MLQQIALTRCPGRIVRYLNSRAFITGPGILVGPRLPVVHFLKYYTSKAVGFEHLAASRAYAHLLRLKGKVHFSRSLADLKADR